MVADRSKHRSAAVALPDTFPRAEAAFGTGSRVFVAMVGCAAVGVGGVGFAAWSLGIPRLAGWDGSGNSMKANTAAALAALGLALVVHSLGRGVFCRLVSAALGLFAATVGGLTLVEHIVGRTFGIDTLLFDETSGGRATASPGRMGPPASLSLLLLGTAVVLMNSGRRARAMIGVLGVVSGAIAMLSLTGYLYGASAMYSMPRLTGIALHTAVTILALALGVIACVPERQPMRAVLDPGPAGLLARRVLPIVVLLPLLIGLARVAAQDAGVVDTELGTALMALITIVVLCGLLWWAVRDIDRIEWARSRAESGVTRRAHELGALYQLSDRLHRARSREEVYEAALGSMVGPLGCDRASILLFDDAGVMRFVAWRGLSEEYRRAVEGHSPWSRDTRSPRPFGISRVVAADIPAGLKRVIRGEGIAALAFVPLVSEGRLIGKFMLYYNAPHTFTDAELAFAETIGRQLSFGVERTRIAAALRESEERYRTLVERVKDYAIFRTDPRGRPTTWNEGVRRVLGYEEREFVGSDLRALIFTPEDVESGVPERELDDAARSGSAGNDRWMMRKDGTRFFAFGVTTALRDESGSLLGFTKIMRDQTEKQQAEETLARHTELLEAAVKEATERLEDSHQRLRASERLASLGTLAAGLGHDMGNLLLPVRVRLESLEQADLPAPLAEDVRTIRASTTYLQRLATGLRLLIADPRRGGGSCELHDWWSEASGTLRASLPTGVRFEHALSDQETWIGMGKTGLTQAVFNLVQNAGEAMRARGWGTVRFAAEDGADAVRVIVSDDGPGMAPEIKARCMEPFYTTKSRRLSTGLGLPLVFSLVEEAGGKVELESEPGTGTTFTLVIPKGRASLPAVAPEQAGVAVVQVRDDRLRAFVSHELNQLSFRVAPAPAPEADLVVVDSPSDAATVSSPTASATIVALDDLKERGSGHGPSIEAVRLALGRAAESRRPGAGGA